MKLFLLTSMLCFLWISTYPQDTTDNSDKLVVLWTSDNPELAKTMVFMYTHNAKRNNWFNDVTLIIWGPSAKLTAENEDIQNELAKMKASGVKIEVCVSCARMFGVDNKLRQLGYDVRGMGKPLSDYLKQNYKVLTL
ncbi:MAG: DsrE family protein [Bacteroidales bacterium]|jgi:hypothetical protein|nr:DsrE family protein [Bacteroidales bacterium]